MSRHHTESAPLAYSYVRFSTPEQLKGDSLRRQTEAAADWCKRHNVTLDTSTTLHDLGKSAYTGKHRENPDRHALAAFLKLVEQGKVPRGSYLVLENLDRLSREHIQPALLLALNLLQAGIRIVQLKPAEMVFDDKSDTLPVMMMMLELSRGHGESALKSERVGDAWAEKKRRARAGESQKETKRMGKECHAMTHKLPGWVEERGGKLRLIPERAAAVKRIFDLSGAGYGQINIIKKLAEEGVKPFKAKAWSRGYIGRILNDRRALGEHQPKTKKGTVADGDPIPDYYPAVVTESEFYAARAGQEHRFRTRGSVKEHINVFAGMLFNAREGDAYYCATRPTGGNRSKVRMQKLLVNYNAIEGRAAMCSFNFATFEKAVLSLLREIDPHDILNGDSGPDESLALAGELATVEGKIGELEAELLQGDVAAVVKVLRDLEAKKADLAAKLAEARQRAAHPLSEAWGQAQSLVSAIDSAPDPKDARLRLRTALRRIVSSIWLLVVPRGRDRLAAVQIWFAGEKKHRDYLVLHIPPKANAMSRSDGGWWARSLAPELTAGLRLDLRKPEHAARLEKYLMKMDLDH
jgi:DNA invertase Pin-like site-specific DNA recombinase